MLQEALVFDHRSHTHGGPNFGRAFAISAALNVAFIATEVVFGLVAGSLALLSDAAHNLGDVLGLMLAWGAIQLARRPPSKRRTYGLRRSTILAALANATMLLVVVGGLTWEAVTRLRHPVALHGETILWVAAVGVLVNGASALLFFSGRRGDVNVRAAFAHLTADAAVSLGVVATGLAIVRTGWVWLDPAVSLVIGVTIAWSTWGLFRESLDLALDAVPAGINPDEIATYLGGLPGVLEVHDLHIWGMSATETSLTAHLVMPDRPMGDEELARTRDELHRRFAIVHATIQVERGNGQARCDPNRENAV
jgi:cobalt-zinc-cadmium efflux system protein